MAKKKAVAGGVDLRYFWKKKTILSFVAIILIVAIHNSATEQFAVEPGGVAAATQAIRNFTAFDLGSIAVPIFFFISGVAMFRNYEKGSYQRKMRSRVKTLLVPYLIWNTVGMIFAMLYTYTPLGEIVGGREPFVMNFANVVSGVFLFKYNFHFWFVYNLIIFVVASPVINFVISRKYLAVPVMVAALCLPLVAENFLEIRLGFVVFYLLGCYVGKHHLGAVVRPVARGAAWAALVGLAGILAVKFAALQGAFAMPVILSQCLLVVALGCAWAAADLVVPKMRERRFYDEFFPVYAVHPYIIAAIVKVLVLVAPWSSVMMLVAEVGGTVATVVVATAVCYAWHRLLPKTYAVAFGRYPRIT